MLNEPVGALDEDLGRAIDRAQRLSRVAAARYGASFDWDMSTDQFVDVLEDAIRAQPASHAPRQMASALPAA